MKKRSPPLPPLAGVGHGGLQCSAGASVLPEGVRARRERKGTGPSCVEQGLRGVLHGLFLTTRAPKGRGAADATCGPAFSHETHTRAHRLHVPMRPAPPSRLRPHGSKGFTASKRAGLNSA